MALNTRLHNATKMARGGSMGRTLSVLIVDEGQAGADEAAAGLKALDFFVQRSQPSEIKTGCATARQVDAIVSFCPAPALPATGRPVLFIGQDEVGPAPKLTLPAHPIQIAARLRSLLRLDVLETIAKLRAADAHDAGSPPAPTTVSAEDASVLYVGAPGPAYLRLRHALEEVELTTVAAFTTFTAFDYMHERGFDAVVLSAEPSLDMAHTVCSAMRRNTRLYHTPAILLTRGDTHAQADEAFARGASDILNDEADAEHLRDRITALSAERRRRRYAKAALEASRGTALLDQASDLFEPGFGLRHFQTLLDHSAQTGQSVTLVALDAEAPRNAGDREIAAALDQFAAMLRHCVRAEDLAVRSSANRFYLVLPNTPPAQAELVSQRVCAIAECTAYESQDPAAPFRLTLTANVTEPLAAETADANLAMAFEAIRPVAMRALRA